MGIDLVTFANHQLDIGSRSFADLTSEIKIKLDSCKFHNLHLLPRPRIESTEHEYWTVYEENEHFSFDTDKRIDFYGPHSWELTFDEYKIDFILGLRYAMWFEQYYGFRRKEWRKMIYKVVKLFGGDRVIYLPDNIIDLYDVSIMDDPFEEIEKHLQINFGDPRKTFKEVRADYKKNYFIDRFEDLELENKIT